MIVSYYQYDQVNPVIEEFIKRVYELPYRYYASELLKRLVHTTDFQLEPAVRKAIAICRLAGIPVQEHFALIYRCDAHGLYRDWKLSEFACSLIIVSYDATGEEVKEIQDSFIRCLGIP